MMDRAAWTGRSAATGRLRTRGRAVVRDAVTAGAGGDCRVEDCAGAEEVVQGSAMDKLTVVFERRGARFSLSG